MLALTSLGIYGFLLSAWSINLENPDIEGLSCLANFSLKISFIFNRSLPHLYLLALLLYLLCLISTLGTLLWDGFLLTEGSTPSGGYNYSTEGASEGGGNNNKNSPKLPNSNSNNSIVSTVSYSKEDVDTANGAEIVNLKNILEDNTLSVGGKNDKVLRMYATKCIELSEAKQILA